jgi:RNA polymerase sigma-70 factor (ECF subfamily)
MDVAFPIPGHFEFTLAATAPPGFGEILARHQTLVFRTAWRMLGSAADAEDITQEVFLKLYATRADQSPAWLYRVTVNLCLDHIRRRKPASDASLPTLADASPSPEQLATQAQRQQLLARYIARLPERERACLVLRDLEELSSPEVAAILGITEETVRTAIHRAKEKLKQWMS